MPQHPQKRFYVGVVNSFAAAEMFKASETPTEASHGHRYSHVIGPFRTKCGAQYMVRHGLRNPHIQCVADAERLAKKEKIQGILSVLGYEWVE